MEDKVVYLYCRLLSLKWFQKKDLQNCRFSNFGFPYLTVFHALGFLTEILRAAVQEEGAAVRRKYRERLSMVDWDPDQNIYAFLFSDKILLGERVLGFLFFFLSLFIYFERVWAGEGQRQRERERIPSRLNAVSTEPHWGARSRKPGDHDLSWNQEPDT